MAETSQSSASGNRSRTPQSSVFQEYLSQHWAEREAPRSEPADATRYALARRHRLSAMHRGQRLVIPAGGTKTRANDTEYRFRADSNFAYLTGWGAAAEPDAVLVMEPKGDGHESTLYFRAPAGRDSDEFYANPAIGEFWIGPRPGLAEIADVLGLACRDLAEFSGPAELDGDLARDIAELRLVKDEFEIAELRAALAVTHEAYDAVLAALPRAEAHLRGERVIEGVFDAAARAAGNGVGYDTIAAAGEHACVLHWTRNDGPVRPGELLLIDAGIELDSLYTADITRTFPISGSFSQAQRMVYDAVVEANLAVQAMVRPGILYKEMHAEAMRVIATRTAEWGLLPVSAEESLKPENQYHRRYMVHGTGHHLGLDVHDCSAARRERYQDAPLQPGMVFTVEPGLYFKSDDLTVPEELRGIGIRVEDNLLVTEHGVENLSLALPREAAEVEAWVQRQRGAGNPLG